MSLITQYIAKRLIATGIVSSGQDVTFESFSEAYEADIAAIVRRVIVAERGES